MSERKLKLQRMLERKSKVAKDVGEEKQSYRCCGGKAKLQTMTERKSKVIVYVREEKQRCRGC